MKAKTLIVFILVILFITSCKSSDKELTKTTPEIAEVIVTINDNTYRSEIDAAATITFSIKLKDPKMQSKIDSCIITTPLNEKWEWSKDDLNNLIEKFNYIKDGFYFDNLSSSDDPHSIPLGTYIIQLNRENHKSSSYKVLVYGRNDPGMITGRLYSVKTEGTPKILNEPLMLSAVKEGTVLKLKFNLADPVIEDVRIAIYDQNNKKYTNLDSFKHFFPDVPFYPEGVSEYNITRYSDFSRIDSVAFVFEAGNYKKIFYAFTTNKIKVQNN